MEGDAVTRVEREVVTRVRDGGGAWPPPPAPAWDLNDTAVRYYVAADGPVDLTALSVHYIPWRDHAPAVYGNVTLYETCAYPIWQRATANGVKDVASEPPPCKRPPPASAL